MKKRNRILIAKLATVFMVILPVIPIQAEGSAKAKAKGANTPGPNLAARLFQLPPGLELNEEQKKAVAKLIEEYEPKLAANQKRILQLLTKEQRVARAALFRKSRVDPDGKAMRDGVAESINLTEEQQRQFSEIQDEKNEIKREALQKFHILLSEEQRAAFQIGGRNRKVDR